jgi:hypothetical protein
MSRRLSRHSFGSAPIARATRCGVPNRFANTGESSRRTVRENRRPAARRAAPGRRPLQHAAAQRRHLEPGIDGRADALQLADGFELCDEVAEIAIVLCGDVRFLLMERTVYEIGGAVVSWAAGIRRYSFGLACRFRGNVEKSFDRLLREVNNRPTGFCHIVDVREAT